jgi:hypothetical protein
VVQQAGGGHLASCDLSQGGVAPAVGQQPLRDVENPLLAVVTLGEKGRAAAVSTGEPTIRARSPGSPSG